MVHEVQRPDIVWFFKSVLLRESACCQDQCKLRVAEGAFAITRHLLCESFAIKPDDNPASGQQCVVELELLYILETAIGHT